MKIGAENPKKVAIAVCLLLIAAFIVIRGITSMPATTTTTASEARPPQATAAAATGRKTPTQVLPESNLDPRLRLDLLQSSEKVPYAGNGRNIFRIGPEPVKVVPQPVRPVIQQPPPPPPPPQINLKFFGFASRQGSNSKVFLAQGEDVFVGGEGDIVDRRYKILRITPNSVEVEDVVNNVRQTLPLQG